MEKSTRLFPALVRLHLLENSFTPLSLFCSIGTGGTLAGTGQYLKAMNRDIIVCLGDPQGSGLYNKVRRHIGSEPEIELIVRF